MAPTTTLAEGGKKFIFLPIFKAIERNDGLYVDGFLAAEEPDFEGEVMRYDDSKPLFQAWNARQSDLTSGKSLGNLRGQHNHKICAGKFVEMDYDDAAKRVHVVAKVVDSNEKEKVREGCYSSFSIGAMRKNVKRVGQYVYWTADPFEGSLVDIGSQPSTRGFSYCALDGKEETRPFQDGRLALADAFEMLGTPISAEQQLLAIKAINGLRAAQKGLFTVSMFADAVSSLISVRDFIQMEREMEGDDSPVANRLAYAADEVLECLAAYTQEQVSEELTRGMEAIL